MTTTPILQQKAPIDQRRHFLRGLFPAQFQVITLTVALYRGSFPVNQLLCSLQTGLVMITSTNYIPNIHGLTMITVSATTPRLSLLCVSTGSSVNPFREAASINIILISTQGDPCSTASHGRTIHNIIIRKIPTMMIVSHVTAKLRRAICFLFHLHSA